MVIEETLIIPQFSPPRNYFPSGVFHPILFHVSDLQQPFFLLIFDKVLACQNSDELTQYMRIEPFEELGRVIGNGAGTLNRLFVVPTS